MWLPVVITSIGVPSSFMTIFIFSVVVEIEKVMAEGWLTVVAQARYTVVEAERSIWPVLLGLPPPAVIVLPWGW